MDHKGEELLGKVWIEFPDCGVMPQTCDLLCFPSGIARGQTVLGLQFAHSVGTPEPFSQQVDECSIEVIDTVPEVAKVGNEITSVRDHNIRLPGAFGIIRLQPPWSGGCLGGSRFDPSYDVRFLQQALRLQQMGDFYHRSMDDRIGHGGAEKGSFELSRFREIGGPFATRLRESEIGARRHGPGRLEHRGHL